MIKHLFIATVLLSFCGLSQTKTDSLWTVLNKAQKTNDKADIYKQLGANLLYSDLDSGAQVCREYLRYAQENNLPQHEGHAYILVGRSFAWRAEFDSAEVYYLKSEQVFKGNRDLEGLADTYINYGGIFFDKADYVTTTKYWEKSLRIAEMLNDSAAMSTNLNNLGEIYAILNNTTKASEYHKRSIHIDSLIGNQKGIAYGYMNWGSVALDEGNTSVALWRYKKAMKIFRELDDKRRIASSYSNIAHVYLAQEKYEDALDQFLLAYDAWEIAKDGWGIAEAKTDLAEIYYLLNEHNKALEFAKAGLEDAKQIRARNLIMRSSYLLSSLYSEKGNFAEAHQHLQTYIDLKDSVYSQTSRDEVTRVQLETAYNFKSMSDSLRTAKEQELAHVQHTNEINKKNRYIWFGVSGSSVLLFFSIVAFRAYRNKKRFSNIIQMQKEQVEFQHALLEEKNRDILSSIEYSKRIQGSILPDEGLFSTSFREYFILYQPKDIIGGDFYWHFENNDYVYWAVVDCTGHGVPGALVSMVASNLLNKTVKELNIEKPGEILDKLSELIRDEFSKGEQKNKDGMDMSLCRYSKKTAELLFAGAFNNGVIIRGNELIELTANRQPVGFSVREEKFIDTSFHLAPNDQIYLFTDGYADQFGGEKGKKFKTANLKKLILEISSEEQLRQGQLLYIQLEEWKGELEQVDDICIIGVKI